MQTECRQARGIRVEGFFGRAQRQPRQGRKPRGRDLPLIDEFIHQRQQGGAMRFQQCRGAGTIPEPSRLVTMERASGSVNDSCSCGSDFNCALSPSSSRMLSGTEERDRRMQPGFPSTAFGQRASVRSWAMSVSNR